MTDINVSGCVHVYDGMQEESRAVIQTSALTKYPLVLIEDELCFFSECVCAV